MTAGTLAVPSAAPAQEVSLIGELRDAQRRTQALCTAADGVVAEEPKVARRLYLRALNTGASKTGCAARGLAGLPDPPKPPDAIKQAEALIRNGYVEEADKLLSAHVAAHPESKDDIPEDLRPDTRALETAEALWAQGYETEAQEQVRAALAADDTNPIPDELQKAERKPLWMREAIGAAGAWLVTAALVGALVVLLVWLVRVILQHARRRIVVEPFTGGGEGAGAALQAEMQDRYHAWTQGSSRMLSAAAGTDKGMPKPTSLTELVPQTGFLIDALNALGGILPNRTWILAGQFLPADPEQGVGLALRLYRKSNGKVLAADTLRQADFQAPLSKASDDSSTTLAYQRLAIAGAAFFLYADRRSLRIRDDYDNLGTHDWRSYAMANSAASYYPAEPQVARDLYRRALKYDVEYRDAHFGIAILDLRRAKGVESELKRVEQELKTVAMDLKRDNLLWYRVKFWLVVSLIYREKYPQARAAAEELFDRRTHWWKARSKLEPFLDKHRPNMLAVLAAALSLDSDDPASDGLSTRLRDELRDLKTFPVKGEHIITQLETHPERWPAAYNLACYYALVRPTGWIDKSLEHLETALKADPELWRYAETDWSLQNLRDEAWVDFRLLVRSKEGRRMPSAGSASPLAVPANGPAPAPA